jgi:16S rRNA (cytosine967-C5)-methyltransferase
MRREGYPSHLARRLRAVISHDPNSAPAPTPVSAAHASLPLARLLNHVADAVQAVRAGQSLNEALARCPADARPGTQALSFHALRWLGSAQAVRALLAPKSPPPEVDALLLTALALLWPDAEPPYAEHTLVDQAVAAARQRAKASAPFVNAVLRRFLRERDATVAAALRDPVARYNHPAWWVQRLKQDWPDHWQTILQANNRRPPMTLRVNARQGSASDYVQRLAERGMASQAIGAQAVVLAQPCPVSQLPGFAQGAVSVQDAAAQRAARLLLAMTDDEASACLPPGARVLDACAAPGGKTAHLLELADLVVLALDRDAGRLARVDQTLARLGLQAQTLAADAGEPGQWWDGRFFDAILLDAPCSASGIVRRHPDVRWLRRPTDIAALWPLLKPGGRLLFCTCSVFKAEGQHQIDAFLQRHAEAVVPDRPVSPGHLLPLPDNQSAPHPPEIDTSADGFFYTLIQRRPD